MTTVSIASNVSERYIRLQLRDMTYNYPVEGIRPFYAVF